VCWPAVTQGTINTAQSRRPAPQLWTLLGGDFGARETGEFEQDGEGQKKTPAKPVNHGDFNNQVGISLNGRKVNAQKAVGKPPFLALKKKLGGAEGLRLQRLARGQRTNCGSDGWGGGAENRPKIRKEGVREPKKTKRKSQPNFEP